MERLVLHLLLRTARWACNLACSLVVKELRQKMHWFVHVSTSRRLRAPCASLMCASNAICVANVVLHV